MDDLLRPRDVARMLGIDTRTLRNWTNDGTIPSVKVGEKKHRRYRREDVEAVLTIEK